MRNLILLLTAIIFTISCVKETQDETARQPSQNEAEKFAATLNSNINALHTIAYEYTCGHGIKACLPDKTGKRYAMLFTDGKSLTLSSAPVTLGNGNMDAESVPMVGIRCENKKLTWILDGRSTGKDASSGAEMPSFKVVDGKISLQFGADHIGTYECTDITVESFFKDMDQDDNGYIIHFSDGNSLDFPGSSTEDMPVTGGNGELRRPVSPEQPMWIVHIDTWLYPDPQKIIDLIPADILPFTVFNLSLSAEGGNAGRWTKVEYGYETAKSWLRTCAMNNVWAMIQPASGAYCHFKDTYTYDEISESLYAEFFREYPNFIGFNYCEQFWGFDEEYSVTYQQRLKHWANLMRLSHEYGGYLIVSCCGPYYAAALNPVAMVKRGAEFTEMCRQYPENLIICEKFTSKYGFYNTESACLGMWLSGFAGQYGIRYDTCGWNETPDNPACPLGAGISALLEHMILTGQTVTDGPELIREECYKEAKETKTTDGYTSRVWETFPQFQNISIDLFRKIIEGGIRIPQKKEVIDRTGIMLINDITAGNDLQKYTAPSGLYQGLYQMDDDGEMLDNRTWFKKTGRFPSIPYAAELNGNDAHSFRTVMNMSEYASKWGNIASKTDEMNRMFPQEYRGDIYAGRIGDTWVTYNPHKEIRRSEGMLGLQLNSCDSIRVSLPNFSSAVIKESADKINAYLNNYDPRVTAPMTDTLAIYGVTGDASITFTDRAEHVPSEVKGTLQDGIYIVSITHNGPVDIEICCSGNASGKSLPITPSAISAPQRPDVYIGELQFEAENFDYKNISSIIRNGSSKAIRNYTGQGYMDFGSKSGASARITFSQDVMAQCAIGIKYMAPQADISNLTLQINGKPEIDVTLSQTKEGEWNVIHQFIDILPGRNTIVLTAKSQSKGSCLLDNITLTPVNSQTHIPFRQR